jgi:hypothetical protein
MQVMSDAAGMISKGAGGKAQKHLPVMRDIMKYWSKRNGL